MLLERLPTEGNSSWVQGYKGAITEIKGRMQDRPITLKAETHCGPLPGSTIGTGKPRVSGPAANGLADGRLSRPGVRPPKKVIQSDAFFDDLAERGLLTRLVAHECVAGD